MVVTTARSIIAIADGEDVLIEITAVDGTVQTFKTDDVNFVLSSLERAREKAWERTFQRKTREAVLLREYHCGACEQPIRSGQPLYLDGKLYCEDCQRRSIQQ